MLPAVAVREVAAGDLRGDVAPEEGGLHDADSGLRPAVVLGHGQDGDRDVDAVAVADDEGREAEAHHAEAGRPAARVQRGAVGVGVGRQDRRDGRVPRRAGCDMRPPRRVVLRAHGEEGRATGAGLMPPRGRADHDLEGLHAHLVSGFRDSGRWLLARGIGMRTLALRGSARCGAARGRFSRLCVVRRKGLMLWAE